MLPLSVPVAQRPEDGRASEQPHCPAGQAIPAPGSPGHKPVAPGRDSGCCSLRFCLTLCSSSCARPKASHLESPSALLRASGCLGIRPALPCMREVKESGHPTEGTSVGTDHQSTPGSAGSRGVSDGVRTRFLLSSPLCWLPIHVVCSGSSSLEDSQRLLEMSLKASVPRVSA